MADRKHTPGPWEARTFMVVGGAGKHDRICHVGTSTSLGPPRSNETFANAQLIAAAPDLVDALELVKGSLAFDREDDVSREVIRRVDAVLTKAGVL